MKSIPKVYNTGSELYVDGISFPNIHKYLDRDETKFTKFDIRRYLEYYSKYFAKEEFNDAYKFGLEGKGKLDYILSTIDLEDMVHHNYNDGTYYHQKESVLFDKERIKDIHHISILSKLLYPINNNTHEIIKNKFERYDETSNYIKLLIRDSITTYLTRHKIFDYDNEEMVRDIDKIFNIFMNRLLLQYDISMNAIAYISSTSKMQYNFIKTKIK